MITENFGANLRAGTNLSTITCCYHQAINRRYNCNQYRLSSTEFDRYDTWVGEIITTIGQYRINIYNGCLKTKFVMIGFIISDP